MGTGEGHYWAGSLPADSSNPLLTRGIASKSQTPDTPQRTRGVQAETYFQEAMVIASLLDYPIPTRLTLPSHRGLTLPGRPPLYPGAQLRACLDTLCLDT